MPGASGYNVWFMSQTNPLGMFKSNATPITGLTYDIPMSDVDRYWVRVTSIDGNGVENDWANAVTGYANLAPTSATAALVGSRMLPSSQTSPTVVDPNYDANWVGPPGTEEVYTYAIVSQPPAGQGTASISNGYLVWSPPVARDFIGSTSFQFSVTDKGGATLVATADVTVNDGVHATPAAPIGVTASQGTFGNEVRIYWTGGVADVAAHNVYVGGSKLNAEPIIAYGGYSVYTSDPTHVDYTVTAISSGGEEGPGTTVSGWPDTRVGPPSTVTAVSGTMAGACSIEVTWSGASNAEYYNIDYRDHADGGWMGYSGPGVPVTGSPFVLQGLECGHTYDIAVFAVNATLNAESGWPSSIPSAVAATPDSPPGAVTNFVATKGTVDNVVQLSWNAASDATSYEIYWVSSPTDNYPANRGLQWIASTTETSYTFNPSGWSTPWPSYGPDASKLYSVRPRSAVYGLEDWPSNPYGGYEPSAAFDVGYPNSPPSLGYGLMLATSAATSLSTEVPVYDSNANNAGQGETFTASLLGTYTTAAPPGVFAIGAATNTGVTVTWSANGATAQDLDNWASANAGVTDVGVRVCDRANSCADGWFTFSMHPAKSAYPDLSYLASAYQSPEALFTLTVTMRNDGTGPWADTDSLDFTADSYDFFANGGQLLSGTQMNAGTVVQPGESYTFYIELQAPVALGSYPLVVQMRSLDGRSFGVATLDPYYGTAMSAVEVTSAATGIITDLSGVYDSASTPPTTLQWSDDPSVSGARLYKIWRKRPADSTWVAYDSVLAQQCTEAGCGFWGPAVYTFNDATLIPGGTSFQYGVSLCSSAQYCSTDTPDTDVNTPTLTLTNNTLLGKDSYVSGFVYGTPEASGAGYWVDITFTNNGSLPWTPGIDRLADITWDQPFSQTMDGRFGPTAGYRELGAVVNPGESVTFSIIVYAPATPGTYNMQWQLIGGPDDTNAEPQTLFGAPTDVAWIEVQQSPIGHPTNLTATQGTVPQAVDVSWTDDPATSFGASYWVWRKPTVGGTWAPVGTYWIGDGFYLMPESGNIMNHDGRPISEDGLHWTVRDPIATAAPGDGTYSYIVGICNLTCSWLWIDANTPDPTSPIAIGFPGTAVTLAAPTAVSATDGTVTNSVQVTWTAVAGATGYNVYTAPTAGGTKTKVANGVTGTSYSHPQGAASALFYSVTATSGGSESASSNEDSGYANLAPSASSAALTATAAVASAPVTPDVTDPNVTAGQAETFTFAILTQPGPGQGTASVVSNQLVWTPPAAHNFTGTTTFTYTVTDKGNANVTGTATVTVSATSIVPLAPTNVVATDGTQTGRVRITWTAAANAASYRVYVAPTTTGNKTEIATGLTATTFDHISSNVSAAYYFVEARSASLQASPYSSPDVGYANVAPTATSATLSAAADAPSAATTPSVTDDNVGDLFTFSVATQPTAGQGTAGIVNNKLVWTPPAAHDFAGTTTFTYTATDRAAASVTGTATVTVSPAMVIPAVPTAVSATDGTVTGIVRVTWTASANAATYKVYRAPTALGVKTELAIDIVGTSYDHAITTTPVGYYFVRAVSAGGAVSRAIRPPTLATRTSRRRQPASPSARCRIRASTPQSPTVTDPNGGDTFTVSIESQPAAGQGSASVSSNKLVWTPPPAFDFSGATSFTYRVTDRGGASVTGTATVNVTPFIPAAPTGLTATKGTVTDLVRLTWTASAKATGYRVYRAGTEVTSVPITATTYDYATTTVASASYTVRAVSVGGESGHSVAATGFPNLAPTSTSAAMVTDAFTPVSAAPTVIDPNAGDAFTFSVTSQPADGQGTASVSNNRLVWTPTFNTVYSGTTSFDYRVTDRAGATLDGNATVRVSAPDLSPISIKFFPSNGLVAPVGMNNRTYTGTTVAGVIRIVGVPGVGGLTVTISKNGGPAVRTVSRYTSFAAAAVTTDAVMGTPQTFHVEAYQSAGAGAGGHRRLHPRCHVAWRRGAAAAADLGRVHADTVLTGSLGVPQRTGTWVYNPALQGSYSLQLPVSGRAGC